MFSGVVSVHSMHSSFNLSSMMWICPRVDHITFIIILWIRIFIRTFHNFLVYLMKKKNDFLCKVLVSSVVFLPCVMLFIFFPCHCTRYMRNILIWWWGDSCLLLFLQEKVQNSWISCGKEFWFGFPSDLWIQSSR